MNMISYRYPQRVYQSDACPRCIGGFVHTGRGWRWSIPENLQFRASVNLLEHLATIVSSWLDIIEGGLKRGMCALSMGDSTTSAGWLVKSNFTDDKYEDPIETKVRNIVCRHHATLFIDYEIREYSQWFPGEENLVADSLTRDDDRSDEELTRVLKYFCPQQVPENFKIQPLPNEIVSWLTSLLQMLPVKPQLQEKHTRTMIGRGEDGSNIPIPSDWEATPSWMGFPDINKSASWVPSPWLTAKGAFRDRLMSAWLKEQSEVPFQLFHRPSGRTTGQTPPGMTTQSLDDFYQGYSARSKTRTLPQNNRKPSPSASSTN